MKRNEFWKDGHRKMRGHGTPDNAALARQTAAHMQRNHQPDQTKNWMGGQIDPNAGEGAPSPMGNGLADGGGAPMPVGRRVPADLDMD